MTSSENQDRGIRRFAPQANGPPQRQGLLCEAFVILEYIRLFLLSLYFISNPVYSFNFWKNYVGGVYSEEKQNLFKGQDTTLSF